MGIFDKVFGNDPEPERHTTQASQREPASSGFAGKLTDEQAIERYRYLLKTAPPEAIEQVRIPAKLNARSGEAERGFRASRTLIGAKRRP